MQVAPGWRDSSDQIPVSRRQESSVAFRLFNAGCGLKSGGFATALQKGAGIRTRPLQVLALIDCSESGS